jgi:hypothetical protein
MEIKAITFGAFDSRGFVGSDARVNEYISRIKATGANTVWLDYQKSYDIITGHQVTAIPSWNLDQNTPIYGPNSVEEMIVKTLAAGMTPVLSPHTNAWNSATKTSGGNMNVWSVDNTKIDVATFFADYQKQVVEAATLSQKYGLPLLSIGIEMNAFDQMQFASYWNTVVDAVRVVYSGKISYGAYADLYNAPSVKTIGFADKLDYVGLSVYPMLGYGKKDATQTEIFQSAYDTRNPNYSKISDWQKYFDDLYTQYGKKIIIHESGFQSFDGTAGSAFVAAGTNTAPVDNQEQVDATFAWQSFLANLSPDKYLGGSIWGVCPADLDYTDTHGNFTGPASLYQSYLKYYLLQNEIIGKPVENEISLIYHASNTTTALPGLSFYGSGTLRGTLGCDTFTVTGNSTITAGLGIDKVVFSGKSTDYTITHNSNGTTTVKNSFVTDTLSDVERLQFSDKTMALDTSGNAGQVYRMYQAALNRTPDKGGLGDWIAAMDTGTTLTDVASGFIGSAEFQGMYANHSVSEVITHLYQNILHRDPEPAGLEYWTNQYNAGNISAPGLLIGFSESAENQANLIGVIQNGFEYYQHV